MAKPEQIRRRKYETMCSVCDEIVGVIYTPFNRDQTVGGYPLVPKTSRHKTAGRWCTGSQLAIPEAMLIPARGTAA